GLRPDFWSRCLVMAAAIGDVVELIGPDGTVGLARRDLLREVLGIADIVHGIGVGNGGNETEIGAAQPEHGLLFLTLRVGHDDDRTVASRVADEGEADASIPCCALDDDATRPKEAALFGVAHDEEGGAILDRSAGIEELGLAKDRAAGELGGAAQANERR